MNKFVSEHYSQGGVGEFRVLVLAPESQGQESNYNAARLMGSLGVCQSSKLLQQ